MGAEADPAVGNRADPDDIPGVTEPFRCPAGTVLVEQDSPARRLFVLTEGQANLSIIGADGTELFRNLLGTGEAIGEAGLGDAPGYFGTATAVTDLRGVAVDIAQFRDLRRDLNPAAYRLLRRLCLGLCTTIRRLNEEIFRERSGSGPARPDTGSAADGPDGRTIPPTDRFMDVLRAMPFFEGFTSSEMDELSGVLRQWEVGRGRRLFTEGEQGDSCFITVRGAVDVSVDRTSGGHHLARLGSGRIFGEISLLDHGPRSATCRVADDAVLIEICGKEFQSLFQAESHLSFKLLEAVYYNLLAAQRASFAERAGQSIAANKRAAEWVMV